jgi:integrase
MKLTQATAAKITVPEGRDEIREFDSDLPCFGLRVRRTGGRSWIAQCRVNGRSHTVTIGSFEKVSAAAARERARTILAKVQLGDDPAKEKRIARDNAAETLGSLAERFIAHKAASARPSYLRQLKTHMRDHWGPLARRSVHDIDRRSIATTLTDIAAERGEYAANRARSTLQTFFSWAQQAGIAENNPVVAVGKKVDEKARDRLLSDDELKAILLAARADGSSDYAAIVAILAHTGQRKSEVGGIARSEINLKTRTWTIPSERAKNGLAHEVWLSDPVLAILETAMARPGREDRENIFGETSGRGFNGWSKAKERLDRRIEKIIGRKPVSWRLHDLRRTVASGMARLGINLPIIEKVLNHTSGSFRGVVGVYQRHDFAKEKAAALAQWAAHVTALVEGKSASSNIVQIRA